MGRHTAIQWTDHTFNPWHGCQKVSEGCLHCYAETNARRSPGVLGRWGPTGTRVLKADSGWREPLKWNAEAARQKTRRRVFCASIADVFEDWQGPMVDSKGRVLHRGIDGTFKPIAGKGPKPLTMDNVRDRLFGLIAATKHLDWLILTKRPENASPYFRRKNHWGAAEAYRDLVYGPDYSVGDGLENWPPRNVWLGVSAENQEQADKRIPILLSIPAAVRFVSAEPLLGPIDFGHGFGDYYCNRCSGFKRWPASNRHCPNCGFEGSWDDNDEPCPECNEVVETEMICPDCGIDGGNGGLDFNECWGKSPKDGISWIIAGGESGPGARPCDVAWIRSIRDQCKAAGVACFVKQLGGNLSDWDSDECSRLSGRSMHDPKGGDPAEWPDDLRIQQFPEVVR